jgi:hypothetical protein
MHIDQALLILLNSLSMKDNKITLGWASVNLWHKDVLNLLIANRLISPSYNKAANIQCQSCEKHCCVDVTEHKYPKRTLYYALCEDAYMHEQMGRMTIPPEQVNQWKITIKQVAVVIGEKLKLSKGISYRSDQKTINLGSLKSKAGRKSILLNIEPLALVVNQQELLLTDILYFEDNKLVLDMVKINHALNLKKIPHFKKSVSNTDKKEQRKATTQAKYLSWQDEYERLKRKYPNKTKAFYAQKIAMLPIAQASSVANIIRVLEN